MVRTGEFVPDHRVCSALYPDEAGKSSHEGMTDGEYEKQYFVKNIEKTLILWEKEVDTPG